jgi:hypothetical protein
MHHHVTPSTATGITPYRQTHEFNNCKCYFCTIPKSEPFANELKAWQYAKQPDRGHRKADPRPEGDVRSLLVVASAVLLVWPKVVTERILLIIDDLDRCLPAESIEILEALKLLLEDPAMAERIIGKLGVAVQEKFKSLIEFKSRINVLTITPGQYASTWRND